MSVTMLTAGSVRTSQAVILRFVEAVRRRSESDTEYRRRAARRHHRSWPLEVALPEDSGGGVIAAALHNASEQGIAFLSPIKLDPHNTVAIRLFWQDEHCPFVGAVVRHATPTTNGYLIGCEFDLGSLSRA